MPSNALLVHLPQLLHDADELTDAHARLRTGNPGRQYRLAALNRATVVMCVSAWESFVEELVREAVETLRPAAGPLGPWPAHKAAVLRELGRFNTPNADNVRTLFSDPIGLAGVPQAWAWFHCTPAQAAQRLNDALRIRHQIAHGVNPRPVVHNSYSRPLPDFIRQLGSTTDTAVRDHLVNALAIPNPWPP